MPDSDLVNFMKQKRCNKDSYYTHVSMISPRGRYQLELDDLDTFWKLYNDAAIKNECIGVAEMPQAFIGAIFDVDLSVALTPDEDWSNKRL